MSYDSFFKQAKKARQSPVEGVEKRKKSLTEEQIELELRKAFGMRAPKKASSKKVAVAPIKKKGRRSFPIYPVVSFVALALGMGSYFAAPDFFNSYLDKVDVQFMGEASASGDAGPAAAGKKTTPSKVESAAKSAASETSHQSPADPKSKDAVAEDPSYFNKLRERKEQLDLREAELNQLEEELQRQKAEIEQRINELTQVRKEIAATLEERVQADEVKVKKLVELYSNMKPKQAADVISSVDSDLAVQVLANMKKKNAADIMNVLSAEKAKELSEKLTGYRRSTASEH